MPKAFTHLCEKVNLSLFNDTLTVYPKSKQEKELPPIRDEFTLMFLMFQQMDCVSAECGSMFDMRKNELGVYRFIHRDDSDHYLYHQDDFRMDDTHYHAQFAKTIDEIKLEDILAILERHTLISSAEHASFLKAYHEANPLPHDVAVSKRNADKESAKSEPTVLPEKPTLPVKKKEEHDEPTFAGFKRGFFLTPPPKSAPTKSNENQSLGMVI